MKQVVLIGAGGHCKVIIDILKQDNGIEIIGLIDKDKEHLGQKVLGVPIIGADNDLPSIFNSNQADSALIAVGGTGDNYLRSKLYNRIKELGYELINAIHPDCTIGSQVQLGMGNVVVGQSIINPGVEVGDNNIINTGSIIEHDVKIGNHVHITPGVSISGEVNIGDYSHLGTGATIIQGIDIGNNCLIGAGAVVIEDIPDNSVVVGNPGEIIHKRGDVSD